MAWMIGSSSENARPQDTWGNPLSWLPSWTPPYIEVVRRRDGEMWQAKTWRTLECLKRSGLMKLWDREEGRICCIVMVWVARERQTVSAPTVVIRDVMRKIGSRNERTGQNISLLMRGGNQEANTKELYTQCLQCKQWFRSRGGLVVHRCAPHT